MIVIESNNPEESKIGWFAYVPKNRVNSENWKLVCEHLNNLEISQENTLYLPVITPVAGLNLLRWKVSIPQTQTQKSEISRFFASNVK